MTETDPSLFRCRPRGRLRDRLRDGDRSLPEHPLTTVLLPSML